MFSLNSKVFHLLFSYLNRMHIDVYIFVHLHLIIGLPFSSRGDTFVLYPSKIHVANRDRAGDSPCN